MAADSERDLVYLVDVAATSTRIVSLPAGSEPGRVVLDDDGQAHVALRSSGRIARIALASAQVQISDPVCQQPRGLAFHAGTGKLHVACADGQLLQLRAATHELVDRTQSDAPDLRDVVLDASGKPLVSRFRSASLWLPERNPSELVLPDLPWPSLDVDRPSTDPVDWVTTRPTFAFRTVMAADGSLWMLHERAQLDPLLGDDFRGTRTQCGAAVQPALTQLDPATGEILSSLQLQGSAAPALDVAFSPSGTWAALVSPSAYAAGHNSARVYRVDKLRDQARVEKQVNAEFPHSAVLMCELAQSTGVAFETQVIAVAFDGNDVLYVQGRYPAALHILRLNPPDNGTAAMGAETIVQLNENPPRDLGHEWFHAELDHSAVSCAACHAEGLDDGHVWQLSKGPRRTPSLRGGLSQTAPYAWDGEHVSLDSAIMRFAGQSMSPNDVSAIAKWLDKLGALSLGPDDPAAVSGKELFESAPLGCGECHTGPKLTNNQTVDVGTGGLFQVPSLAGLSLRAPYMHDGCARDLDALFAASSCAPQAHAKLSTLSAEQAADLRAYLHSL